VAKKRGNGEGSIYRRKNGTWAAQYTVWTTEGRKRRSASGKTRAEVSRKLTEAMADRDGGFLYDAGTLTIGEYLDRWLADSVKGTVKETTYANYAYITHKHISPALGHVKPKMLTPAHVRGFYGEKARTNLAATTVKKMHVVLRKALSGGFGRAHPAQRLGRREAAAGGRSGRGDQTARLRSVRQVLGGLRRGEA
jgi:integrase